MTTQSYIDRINADIQTLMNHASIDPIDPFFLGRVRAVQAAAQFLNDPSKNEIPAALLDLATSILSGDSIDFRDVVSSMVGGRQAFFACKLGIRRATISDYLNEKSALGADSLEAILNLRLE